MKTDDFNNEPSAGPAELLMEEFRAALLQATVLPLVGRSLSTITVLVLCTTDFHNRIQPLIICGILVLISLFWSLSERVASHRKDILQNLIARMARPTNEAGAKQSYVQSRFDEWKHPLAKKFNRLEPLGWTLVGIGLAAIFISGKF